MNTDQFTNLVQKTIGYGGTWLAANGYQSHSLSQALVGAAVALLTWYWSHRTNASTTVVPPGSSQSPGKGPILALLFCFSLAIAGAGCTTSEQTAAFQGATATDATVRTAMIGWGAYVTVAQPGPATEQKVFTAFEAYKNSELALIDATENLSTNAAATNLVSAAQIAELAAQADLLNLITAITNAPPTK